MIINEVSKVVKVIETESRMVVALVGLGAVRKGELVFNGCRVSAGEDEKVLEIDGEDS